MNKPKLVIGNIKMNLETSQARDEYITNSLEAFRGLSDSQKSAIVICPPFLYIESFVQAYKFADVAVGGQNAHQELRGKNTGEISPKMLASIGAQCVILGHSERRATGETLEQVIQKVINAILTGLTPIICVGFTVGSKDAQDEGKILKDEVNEIVSALNAQQVQKVIFAYEPVWAIGSGKTPTPEHIHTMTLVVRKAIVGVHGPDTKEIPVLYGGSITTENVREICVQSHIDGVLVGGASLDPANLARMSSLLNQ